MDEGSAPKYKQRDSLRRRSFSSMEDREGKGDFLTARSHKSSSFVDDFTLREYWWREERAVYSERYRIVSGIDEAGRGSLAGPVVAACVVLPWEWISHDLDDSKQLSPIRRQKCYHEILCTARGVGTGLIDSSRIDSTNILRASHEAMRLALDALPAGIKPDLALIDGYPVTPFPVDQVALVGGDALSGSIAAASIVAKVVRDGLMNLLDQQYPEYGFAVHKGYGTLGHLSALKKYGPCPIHRLTFRPVCEMKVSIKENESP